MILKAGEIIFHEHYVCFHFYRENIYCPWSIIGIQVCYYNDTRAHYLFEYEHITSEYYKEADLAGDKCGTYEFLDNWRKNHTELNSVISKPIKYYHVSNKLTDVLRFLVKDFIGKSTPNILWKVGVMLRNANRHFHSVLTDTDYDTYIRKILKKEKLI